MTHLQDESLSVYIDSLPKQQNGKSGTWRRTRISPCPIVFGCRKCGDYLPASHFYKTKRSGSRVDILGNKLASQCKSCGIKYYVGLDHRKKLLYAARIHANQKGMVCTITVDDIVVPTHCPVLGTPLVPKVGQGRKNRHEIGDSPTIDRVDNSKGYVPGNICVISGRANHLKSNATLDEVKAIVRYMERHMPSTETDATTTAEEVIK